MKQIKGIPKPASMIIKYLKCRADLNFEVDFRSNDVIGTKSKSRKYDRSQFQYS